MPKYRLSRSQKKQPLKGIRKEDRNGTLITHNVDVVFEPGKVVDTGDVDMDHWLSLSLLTKIEEKAEVEVSVGPVVEAVVVESEPETKEDVEKVDEPEEPVEDVENGDDSGDYEESKDGGFRCLHCGKELRTENGMVSHIEAKH